MYNTTSQKDQFFQPSSDPQVVRVLAHAQNPIYEIFVPALNEDGTPIVKSDGKPGVKPFRSTMYPTVKPAEAGEKAQKVFYHLLYNETKNILQVWGVKQTTVLNALQEIKSKCGEHNLNEVTIIVTRKGLKKDDTTYFVLPHTSRKGDVEFSEVPANVAAFYALTKSNGDINFSRLMVNEYPLQGMAAMPIPKVMVEPSIAALLDADFTSSQIIASQLLKKLGDNDEITEGDVSYSRYEIENMLNSKEII